MFVITPELFNKYRDINCNCTFRDYRQNNFSNENRLACCRKFQIMVQLFEELLDIDGILTIADEIDNGHHTARAHSLRVLVRQYKNNLENVVERLL